MFSKRGGNEHGAMYVNTAPPGLLARKNTQKHVRTYTNTMTSCPCRFYETNTESTVSKKIKGAPDRNISSVKQRVHDQQGRAHRPCMGTELKDVLLSQDVWIDYCIWFFIAL